MARDYELMYIIRPDLDEEGLVAAMASVETIVGAQGGEIVKTTAWGKRRLAFEIEKLRDGHYVILHILLEPEKVREIERLLAIHDTVFRHMITTWVPERERAVADEGERMEREGREGRDGRDRDRDGRDREGRDRRERSSAANVPVPAAAAAPSADDVDLDDDDEVDAVVDGDVAVDAPVVDVDVHHDKVPAAVAAGDVAAAVDDDGEDA